MKRFLALGLVVTLVLSPLMAAAQVVEYYHTDALGSVRATTNQAGQVIERHDYLPFGEECTTGPCATNPGVGAGEPRKFTGKERDLETGLDYFGARYHRASTARFSSVDPFLDLNRTLSNPQRWNRYAYVANNPLRFTDADGRSIGVEIIDFGEWAGRELTPEYKWVGPIIVVIGTAVVVASDPAARQRLEQAAEDLAEHIGNAGNSPLSIEGGASAQEGEWLRDAFYNKNKDAEDEEIRESKFDEDRRRTQEQRLKAKQKVKESENIDDPDGALDSIDKTQERQAKGGTRKVESKAKSEQRAEQAQPKTSETPKP